MPRWATVVRSEQTMHTRAYTNWLIWRKNWENIGNSHSASTRLALSLKIAEARLFQKWLWSRQKRRKWNECARDPKNNRNTNDRELTGKSGKRTVNLTFVFLLCPVFALFVPFMPRCLRNVSHSTPCWPLQPSVLRFSLFAFLLNGIKLKPLFV